MRLGLIALLCSIPLFANYGQQMSFKLDAGVTSFTYTNSGTIGGSVIANISPGTFTRLGITLTTIPVPPAVGTTYTTCADPCGTGGTVALTTLNREWGVQYLVVEWLDSGGSPQSPRKISTLTPAYVANNCAAAGMLPMVSPAAVTTSPLPMPREVIGQDCFVDATQVPLVSGHGTTGIRRWVEGHNLTYNTLLPSRIDGKISLQVNNSAWSSMSNTNSGVMPVDEQRFQTVDNYGTSYKFGGTVQVRDYIITVPDGTISGGDTTAILSRRFNGTEGVSSGSRFLEDVLIESADYAATAATCSSGVMTINLPSNALATGDYVLIRGAAGVRVVNGLQGPITKSGNNISFTPNTRGSGGSKPAIYVCTNGQSYMPPTDYNTFTSDLTDQAYLYVAKSLTSLSAYAYPDGSVEAAPAGGDASAGQTLFTTATLVNSNLPYLNYSIGATCSSCHTSTGWDLGYHKFSNASIIQRSIFHGLTAINGRDIAAYIRSLGSGTTTGLQAPYAAYPWNPPWQTGPGMSAGTYYVDAALGAGLTSIACASNFCTAIVPGGHGYRTGDPVVVAGATVDTDLGSTAVPRQYRITVTSSTQFTFTTSSVGNNTYTESTLSITNGNDMPGGCGIDCVSAYGNDILTGFGSASNWGYTSRVDTRNLVYPVPNQDWMRFWLPAVFPQDVYPTANFTSSTPYTETTTFISGLRSASCPYGAGCFTAYKNSTASGVGNFGSNGASGGAYAYIYWYGRNPSDTNNQFSYPSAAGTHAPAQINLYRLGVPQYGMVSDLWQSNVELGLGAFDGQRKTFLNSSAATDACYTPWGIAGFAPFNVLAPHKMTMWASDAGSTQFFGHIGGIGEGWFQTWNQDTDSAYVWTLGGNGVTCVGVPDGPDDSQYLIAFRTTVNQHRAQGYSMFLPTVVVPAQQGAGNADFAYHGGSATQGTDWVSVLRSKLFTPGQAASWQWLSISERQTLVGNLLTNTFLPIINAHITAYWQNIMANLPDPADGADCVSGKIAWDTGSNICSYVAFNISYFKLYGANGTDLTTFVNWAKAVWPGSSSVFDAALTAGVQGDTYGDYGTGNLTVAGVNTITFTQCPGIAGTNFGVTALLITNGTDKPDIVDSRSTTGTCSAAGSPGTLVLTTAYAHAAGWKLTAGCSAVSPNFNWAATFPSGVAPAAVRCINSF